MIVLLAHHAVASVNLELRATAEEIGSGCPVRVQLVATSDTGSTQLVAAVQVILQWNPAQVQLIGADTTGSPTWLTSGFGSDPYQLNASIADGDAMWIAYAPLGAANAVAVSPAGTLLTTFRFQSAPAIAGTATMLIARSAGNPTGHTIVFDGLTPNLNITGTLTSDSVDISPCNGDVNHTGEVNLSDLLTVINHWGACPSSQACCPGDATADGSVTVTDLLAVINQWGLCPESLR